MINIGAIDTFLDVFFLGGYLFSSFREFLEQIRHRSMILSRVRYGEAAGGDSAPATASDYPIVRLSFKVNQFYFRIIEIKN